LPTTFNEKFQRFTRVIEHAVGSPWAFTLAVGSIVVWGLCGPLFGFSDTWQLVCNTATTIVSYLLLFLIQSTQTHDTAALQLKLDELIVATKEAHNTMVGAEDFTEKELNQKRQELRELKE